MCVMWQVCHLPLFLPFSSSLPLFVALQACGREGRKKTAAVSVEIIYYSCGSFFGGSIPFLRGTQIVRFHFFDSLCGVFLVVCRFLCDNAVVQLSECSPCIIELVWVSCIRNQTVSSQKHTNSMYLTYACVHTQVKRLWRHSHGIRNADTVRINVAVYAYKNARHFTHPCDRGGRERFTRIYLPTAGGGTLQSKKHAKK